jgi:hypothetical protein
VNELLNVVESFWKLWGFWAFEKLLQVWSSWWEKLFCFVPGGLYWPFTFLHTAYVVVNFFEIPTRVKFCLNFLIIQKLQLEHSDDTQLMVAPLANFRLVYKFFNNEERRADRMFCLSFSLRLFEYLKDRKSTAIQSFLSKLSDILVQRIETFYKHLIKCFSFNYLEVRLNKVLYCCLTFMLRWSATECSDVQIPNF